MNSKSLLIILAIIILAGIAYFALANNRPEAPSQMATTTQENMPAATPDNTAPSTGTNAGGAAGNVTITYGPNGFSPENVTVPVGTRVTWVNQGSGRMWVGSSSHPSHTGYDGTSASEHCADGAPTSATVFDQCSAGSSFSFTFTKAGTWTYHNHAQSSDHGTITVTP